MTVPWTITGLHLILKSDIPLYKLMSFPYMKQCPITSIRELGGIEEILKPVKVNRIFVAISHCFQYLFWVNKL